MEKIGPDGIIKIESSSSIYTTVEVQEGMKVHLRGQVQIYMQKLCFAQSVMDLFQGLSKIPSNDYFKHVKRDRTCFESFLAMWNMHVEVLSKIIILH